jgi:hypothetical protein
MKPRTTVAFFVGSGARLEKREPAQPAKTFMAKTKTESPLTDLVRNRGHEQSSLRIQGALKLKEARAYLGGISVPSIHRLIKRGLLKPNRALRHLIFSKAELDRFLHNGMS